MMTRATAIRLLLFGTLPGLRAQDKKRKPKQAKPPDLTILTVAVRRSDGEIILDGKVKNTGEKPLQNVDLLIDFRATAKQVLTTKRGPVESERLEPQGESDFHLRINDYARAIEIFFNAEEKDRRDLRVENTGPFPIE